MRIRDDIAIDGYKGFVFIAKTVNTYTHESIVRAFKHKNFNGYLHAY